MRAPNLIHGLTLDVAYEGGVETGESLAGWLREALLPVVDTVLAQHDRAGQVTRIERLEIDLGSVLREDAEDELARRLSEQLASALDWSSASPGTATTTPAAGTATTTPAAGAVAAMAAALPAADAAAGARWQLAGEQLLNFLRSGRLPWSVAADQQAAHEHLLRQVLAAPKASDVLKEVVQDQDMLVRLVRQFNADLLAEVARVLHPQRRPVRKDADEAYWLAALSGTLPAEPETSVESNDAALEPFRNWQQRGTEMPSQLDELRQWLIWWLMHDSNMVNQDCSLMLESIGEQCAEARDPVQFMRLVLTTLRAGGQLDLEEIAQQSASPAAMDAITTLRSQQSIRNFIGQQMAEDARLDSLNSAQLHQLVRGWIGDPSSLFLAAVESHALQVTNAHDYFLHILQSLLDNQPIDLETPCPPAPPATDAATVAAVATSVAASISAPVGVSAPLSAVVPGLSGIAPTGSQIRAGLASAAPGGSSPLPALLQQGLPQRLASAMLQADLSALEVIWPEITRYHADVLIAAVQRYLRRPQERTNLVARSSPDMVVAMLKAISPSAGQLVEPILRHAERCGAVLSPPLQADEITQRVLNFALQQVLAEEPLTFDRLIQVLLPESCTPDEIREAGYAWRSMLPSMHALDRMLFGDRYLLEIKQRLQDDDGGSSALHAMLAVELCQQYPELVDAPLREQLTAADIPLPVDVKQEGAVIAIPTAAATVGAPAASAVANNLPGEVAAEAIRTPVANASRAAVIDGLVGSDVVPAFIVGTEAVAGPVAEILSSAIDAAGANPANAADVTAKSDEPTAENAVAAVVAGAHAVAGPLAAPAGGTTEAAIPNPSSVAAIAAKADGLTAKDVATAVIEGVDAVADPMPGCADSSIGAAVANPANVAVFAIKADSPAVNGAGISGITGQDAVDSSLAEGGGNADYPTAKAIAEASVDAVNRTTASVTATRAIAATDGEQGIAAEVAVASASAAVARVEVVVPTEGVAAAGLNAEAGRADDALAEATVAGIKALAGAEVVGRAADAAPADMDAAAVGAGGATAEVTVVAANVAKASAGVAEVAGPASDAAAFANANSGVAASAAGSQAAANWGNRGDMSVQGEATGRVAADHVKSDTSTPAAARTVSPGALALKTALEAEATLAVLLMRAEALGRTEQLAAELMLQRVLRAQDIPLSGALETALSQPSAIERLVQLAPAPALAQLLVHLQAELAAQLPTVLRAVATSVPIANIPALQGKAHWRTIYQTAFVTADPITPAEFIRNVIRNLGGKADTALPPVQPAAPTPQAAMQALLQPLDNRAAAQAASEHACEQAQEDPTPFTGESNIRNAGMVIIATYAQRLFSILELTKDGQFTSDEAAQRAVHLLQYAITGATATPEYQLVLNKLLCGIHGGQPIARGIDITDKEKDTIEQMLNGVIAHWKALGKTSIAGLRQTFLQREGHLYFEEEAWRLKIPTATFDMLLDRLPWSFAMIKFPWMEHALHVTWR